MLDLKNCQDLTEVKEEIIEYCTSRIDYLEGDECSIEESVERIEEVDFLEELKDFVEERESEL